MEGLPLLLLASTLAFAQEPATSALTAATDSTISIGCSDVTENTYVLLLEWRCKGACSKGKEETLVKFTRGRGVTSQRDPRYTLHQERFDLNLTSVRTEDAGEYYCLVNNKVEGADRVRVEVVAPTSPPSRPLVTGFSSRSVDLSWTSPRPSSHSPREILGYLITVSQKSVKDEDSVSFKKSQEGPIFTNSSATKFRVTNLRPFTVYAFQIQAVNEVGNSRPSRQSYPAITLMEKPSGKPAVTAAHNTSSTSIYLEWTPPALDSLNGEFSGYLISYRPRDTRPQEATEVTIADPQAKSHTLEELSVFTQYLVSLRVFNPEGPGPDTIVVVMTDEGAPSPPRNTKVLSVTDTSIQLSWWEPARANGNIQGYRLYFSTSNVTSMQPVTQNKSAMVDTLTQLAPYTEYRLWIRAYTAKHEGKPSEEQKVWTDVRAPDPPSRTGR